MAQTTSNGELAAAIATKNNMPTKLSVQHELAKWNKDHSKTIVKLLGGHKEDAERLYLGFAHAVQRSTDLLECTPDSLQTCLLLCAQLGLFPGPFQEAAITWRRNKEGKKEAQFVAQWQGLVKLGKQTGYLLAANTNVVYEADDFDYMEGTEMYLKYRKSLEAERGNRIGVYGVFYLPNNAKEMRIMTPAEIQAIRNRSDAGKKGYGPWATDEDAMWMKTVIRQLCKFVPKQGKAGEQLAQALEADDEVSAPDLRRTPIVEFASNPNNSDEAPTAS